MPKIDKRLINRLYDQKAYLCVTRDGLFQVKDVHKRPLCAAESKLCLYLDQTEIYKTLVDNKFNCCTYQRKDEND